jgi:hypothetical protein
LSGALAPATATATVVAAPAPSAPAAPATYQVPFVFRKQYRRLVVPAPLPRNVVAEAKLLDEEIVIDGVDWDEEKDLIRAAEVVTNAGKCPVDLDAGDKEHDG